MEFEDSGMQRSQVRGQSHLLRGLPLEAWGIRKLRDEVTGEGGGIGVPYRELACVAASWAEDIK